MSNGKEQVDVLTGMVVRPFDREYGINLIYVSVDGKTAPELTGSQSDYGQTEAYQSLAYGFHSQEDLASQLLLV